MFTDLQLQESGYFSAVYTIVNMTVQGKFFSVKGMYFQISNSQSAVNCQPLGIIYNMCVTELKLQNFCKINARMFKSHQVHL